MAGAAYARPSFWLCQPCCCKHHFLRAPKSLKKKMWPTFSEGKLIIALAADSLSRGTFILPDFQILQHWKDKIHNRDATARLEAALSALLARRAPLVHVWGTRKLARATASCRWPRHHNLPLHSPKASLFPHRTLGTFVIWKQPVEIC